MANKVIEFLDTLFKYMPPIKQATDTPTTSVAAPSVPTGNARLEGSSIQEDAAAGTSFYHTIPGEVGAGGLTPSQFNAVIAQAKPQSDVELDAIKSIGLNAAKGAVATTASTIAAGGTLGEGVAASLPSIAPALGIGIDIDIIGLAGYDMLGGDIDVNKLLGTNAAGLSPAEMQVYNQLLASGNTTAAEQFLMKAENRLGTKSILTDDGSYTMVGRNAPPIMNDTAVDNTDLSLDYVPRAPSRTLA